MLIDNSIKMNNNSSRSSINLTSRTGFYTRHEPIFTNTSMVTIILIIGLLFIGYAFYKYYFKATEKNIQSASSYYGKDITLYEPLFKDQTNTISDCVSICEQDVICDGITYNNNTQICTGTKNGIIRNETSEYSAWVKSRGETPIITADFTKAILVGFTKSARIVDKLKIPNPYMIGNFSWSFNLVIYDFYKNFGSWRHIFHKGTDIPSGQILSFQSWENLVKEYPNQQIGVWLSPFTNNLRIAITTTSLGNRSYGSYNDAFVQKCDSTTASCFITDMPSGKWTDTSRISDGTTPNNQIVNNLEFFDQDIQNIPINKEINITINFYNNIAEVYFNGKIIKVSQLEGTPKVDKSHLYVLNDKTAGCKITNLLYFPDNLTLADINTIMNIKPETN